MNLRELSVDTSPASPWLNPEGPTRPVRFLRLPAVLARCGDSKTTFYDKIKKGHAPAPRLRGRAAFWLEEEVDRWLEQLV